MARNAEALKIRPWAANGDRKNPDDATLSPALARADGWPASFSQASGDTPRREVVNQLFCEITSMLDEINTRGILEWSNAINYAANAVVQAGGKLWRAGAATGPGAGNATNPETVGQQVWQRIDVHPTVPAQVGEFTARRRDTALGLEWAAPQPGRSPILGYDIDWKSGAESYDAARRAAVAADAISYEIPNLVNGRQYTVRIRARNAISAAPWSAEITGTPGPVAFVRINASNANYAWPWDAPKCRVVVVGGDGGAGGGGGGGGGAAGGASRDAPGGAGGTGGAGSDGGAGTVSSGHGGGGGGGGEAGSPGAESSVVFGATISLRASGGVGGDGGAGGSGATYQTSAGPRNGRGGAGGSAAPEGAAGGGLQPGTARQTGSGTSAYRGLSAPGSGSGGAGGTGGAAGHPSSLPDGVGGNGAAGWLGTNGDITVGEISGLSTSSRLNITIGAGGDGGHGGSGGEGNNPATSNGADGTDGADGADGWVELIPLF